MISDSIYEGMTNDQYDILGEILGNKVFTNIHINNLYYRHTNRWMAILNDFLTDSDKRIVLTSTKYYYKQSDLDYYFPTNKDSQVIGPPFSSTASQSEYEICFVDTTTGAKIYEYLSELCKALPESYIDRPSLAVSLTEDRTHKVRIVNSNNTVWVLSNRFSNDFVDKCIALFPFLFDIKELQEDENVMKVCRHVAKGESIKDDFQELFDSLEEIRAKQKIELIKTALNARIEQQTNQIKRERDRVQDNINTLQERLNNYYEELEQANLKLLGITTKKNYDEEQVNEILDFVNRNRYIQSMTVKSYYSGYSGDQVQALFLDIIAPISIYESEPLARYIDAKLDYWGRQTTKGKILRAFKRIFVDEELQMICETYLRLDLANVELTGSNSSQNLSYSDYKRLCQPHLTRYNCWGDNLNPIKEMLREGKICDALNNILIATQNINFTDTTVLESFLDIIASSNNMKTVKSCLSKADGQLWSIQDIIDQLDREENAEKIEQPALEDTIPEADNITE